MIKQLSALLISCVKKKIPFAENRPINFNTLSFIVCLNGENVMSPSQPQRRFSFSFRLHCPVRHRIFAILLFRDNLTNSNKKIPFRDCKTLIVVKSPDLRNGCDPILQMNTDCYEPFMNEIQSGELYTVFPSNDRITRTGT